MFWMIRFYGNKGLYDYEYKMKYFLRSEESSIQCWVHERELVVIF
jgi:hypothetical protein